MDREDEWLSSQTKCNTRVGCCHGILPVGDHGTVYRCPLTRPGASQRQIAADLGRSPSTIARELKRNSLATRGYDPEEAQRRARSRRWQGARLERDPVLREHVLTRLEAHWSPEQVAGRLAREVGRQVISYESIYRFIDGLLRRTKDYRWRRYLPQGRSRRGRRGRRGGMPASRIAHRRPLAQRPQEAWDREVFGHWEADLMLFGRSGPVLLALHERHSRLLLAVRQAGKAADPVAAALERLLASLPPEWRQTVAFDNGSEFARHHRLHALGIQTFFCDTRSLWQKGGVENATGRLRRPLPRKTQLADLCKAAFTQAIQIYNNTPRKCLGYRTPAEVLRQQVLHFNCEPVRFRGNDGGWHAARNLVVPLKDGLQEIGCQDDPAL